MPTHAEAEVVLATCSALPDGDEDAAALLAALERQGLTGRWLAWDDPAVSWTDLPLVVVRSTWDYAARRGEFLAWARTIPHLANDAEVLRWNSDKVYLRDLAEAGIPIVPSTWIAEGDPIDLPEAEMVVKPSVGAGSLGAGGSLPTRATPRRSTCGLCLTPDAWHSSSRT